MHGGQRAVPRTPPYAPRVRVPERLAELAGPDEAAAVVPGQVGFERLEWLGDSVLDVLVSRHLCLSQPAEVSVHGLGVRHSALVSDRATTRVAARFDLPQVQPAEQPTRPEDTDVRHRQGDSVEARIGAAWLTGGWRTAAEAVTLLVLTDCEVDQLLVRAGCPGPGLAEPPKQLAVSAAELGWEPGDARWLTLVVAPFRSAAGCSSREPQASNSRRRTSST